MKQKRRFGYKEIKKVYTITLYEKSPKEFLGFPDDYLHYFSQKSNTGIEIDLLQEYVFISLDNFRDILHNNDNKIRNKLEAWFVFLSMDEPEMIERLIREYPQFKKYYEEIYELCRNTEKVMGMFSKELQELDRNTVQYMIDDMQDEIDAQKNTIDIQKNTIDTQERLLNQKDGKINAQKELLNQKDEQIDAQEKLLNQKEDELKMQNKEIEILKRQLAQLQGEATGK